MSLLNPNQRHLVIRTLRGLGYLCLVPWVLMMYFDKGAYLIGIIFVPPALILHWLAHFIKLADDQDNEP